MPGTDTTTAALASIARRLPSSLRRPARGAYVRFRYAGRDRWCPCCDATLGSFAPYGTPPRPNRACPHCGSLKRHRLLWLYLDREVLATRPDPIRVLHVAPERALRPTFQRRLGITCISIDRDETDVAVRGGIEALPLASGSVDLIVCSHVLEHVDDDRAAMRELLRLLAPGGEALIMVPIDASRDDTFEDPSIRTPSARLAAYGHVDHVRHYGNDFAARLRAEGFTVDAVDYAARLPAGMATRVGATGNETIFVAAGQSPPDGT